MSSTLENAQSPSERNLPTGTFLLIRDDEYNGRREKMIMLDPIPSNDPNEPLNWSTTRKAINFTLVLAISCLIFTAISIQLLFWQEMVVDLNVTYAQLNNANSVNYVGLSMGCVLFIPLARKYGRRLVYLLSIALMFVTSIWLGRIQSLTELYIANLLQGLAGATNESLVQITIADLFFVHHRGGMNALYMSMVMAGSFLTPIAAGTQAVNQDWRWSYYTLSIFNAVLLLLFVVGYEETKYIKVVDGIETSNAQNDTSAQQNATRVTSTQKFSDPQVMSKADLPFGPSVGHHELDYSIPMNPWRKRLALFTPSSEPLWPHYYRPFYILIRFPTVLYTGLQYAAGVVWLTVMVTMFALVFPLPPYNFNPAQIGYLGIGPLIGNLIGAFYGGFLGDNCILFFARRNKGYYEPEMRLYIQHIPAVLLCGGLIMFGVTTQRGMHWIYSQIGGAFFGFGLGSISDAALTLVIDSYPGIVGDAFTAIAFLRNVVSIGIPFAINVWWANDGLQNMFLTCGFIGLAVAALAIPMVVWGRKSRESLGPLYQEMAMKNRQ